MPKCNECRKQNHFKVVCKSIQQQDQQGGKTVHDIGQEGVLHIVEPEEQGKSFDAVSSQKIR